MKNVLYDDFKRLDALTKKNVYLPAEFENMRVCRLLNDEDLAKLFMHKLGRKTVKAEEERDACLRVYSEMSRGSYLQGICDLAFRMITLEDPLVERGFFTEDEARDIPTDELLDMMLMFGNVDMEVSKNNKELSRTDLLRRVLFDYTEQEMAIFVVYGMFGLSDPDAADDAYSFYSMEPRERLFGDIYELTYGLDFTYKVREILKVRF